MRASCVLLILAVLLSSTLAKPMAYVDRDRQSGTNNDYLQYLLHRHVNGIQIVLSHTINFESLCVCVCVCVCVIIAVKTEIDKGEAC